MAQGTLDSSATAAGAATEADMAASDAASFWAVNFEFPLSLALFGCKARAQFFLERPLRPPPRLPSFGFPLNEAFLKGHLLIRVASPGVAHSAAARLRDEAAQAAMSRERAFSDEQTQVSAGGSMGSSFSTAHHPSTSQDHA